MTPQGIEEYDIRKWFMTVDLEQAVDTYRVVAGIIETRQVFEPKRKRRSDAGAKRATQDTPIDLRELGAKPSTQPTLLKADD
jgi:hypothetical protein